MIGSKVVIVATTCFVAGERGIERYTAALKTISSWKRYLQYSGDVHLHIADDGSDANHFKEFKAELNWYWQTNYTISIQNRKGVGASLNAGCAYAFNKLGSTVVFYAVDDWSLIQDFDISPWVDVLRTRLDIGMIRVGPPHPNLTGRIEHLAELGWGLLLDNYSFAYAQRPALYHRRFFESYGWFPEDISAIDCEREYSERVNSTEGPRVMLALPHPWKHIDTISMSDWTPA